MLPLGLLPSLGGAWALWTTAALVSVCWFWETLPQVIQPGNPLHGSLGLDSSLLNELAVSQDRAFNGQVIPQGTFLVTQCHLLFNATQLLPSQSCCLARLFLLPAHLFSPNFSIPHLSDSLSLLSLGASRRARSNKLAATRRSPVWRLPLQDILAYTP